MTSSALFAAETVEQKQERHLLMAFAFVALAFATWMTLQYLQQPLLERHGFRQTQTGLSIYWILKEGWQLNYQTPVAGFPWSIPFEFPLYQWLVALWVQLTGWSIDASGRFISFLALVACAYPAHLVAGRLKLPRKTFWLFCALLWSSPLHLFWGRTVMIETTALLLALMAVPFALDFMKSQVPLRSALLLFLFGTLACLQKATTGGPILLVMGLVWLAFWYQRSNSGLAPMRNIVTCVLAFGLPILITLIWTRHTDVVKGANALGNYLTSSALRDWNFGSFGQRVSPRLYVIVFWERMLVGNAAGWLGLLLIAASIVKAPDRALRQVLLAALALFVVPVLIFSNLHLVHDYYQVGSALFLIAALAISASIVLPTIVRVPYATAAAAAILIGANIYAFVGKDLPLMQRDYNEQSSRVLAIAAIVREQTAADSGLIVFGNDWNSDLAYYAQRKSFTVANFYDDKQDVVNNPEDYLGPLTLGAVVICPARSNPDVSAIINAHDWSVADVAGCTVLFRPEGQT